MTVLTQHELSERMAETLAQLASSGEPVLIEDIAVLISASEYQTLRELEDRLDLAEMTQAKAESEGVVPYTWSQDRKRISPS